jgi:acetylornithine aminotransferase
MGRLITDSLLADSAAAANIVEVRGRGLMLGVQLKKDCPELTQRAFDAGLLINVTAGNTIRLLPPLVINQQEAQALAAGVAKLIREA